MADLNNIDVISCNTFKPSANRADFQSQNGDQQSNKRSHRTSTLSYGKQFMAMDKLLGPNRFFYNPFEQAPADKISPRCILSEGITSEEKIKPAYEKKPPKLQKIFFSNSFSRHSTNRFSQSEEILEESPVLANSKAQSQKSSVISREDGEIE